MWKCRAGVALDNPAWDDCHGKVHSNNLIGGQDSFGTKSLLGELKKGPRGGFAGHCGDFRIGLREVAYLGWVNKILPPGVGRLQSLGGGALVEVIICSLWFQQWEFTPREAFFISLLS